MQRTASTGRTNARLAQVRLARIVGLAAFLASGGALAKDPAGSILGTPDQIAKDRLAVQILASPELQAGIRTLEATYAQDPTASLPDARKTLNRAAEATAMSQAAYVVNADVDRPSVYWSVTAAHSWGSLHVPLAGVMIDNPDNVYRSIPIDGAAKYVIHGQVIGTPPSQETIVLHNATSGATKDKKVKDHEEELGSVSLDKMKLAPDGSFTVTIDNSPADGSTNHIQSRPGDAHGYLLIRDTLTDWTRENPVKLSVERADGPPLRPAATEPELARHAAELMGTVGPYWVAWAHKTMLDLPVNTYTHSLPRVGGWGFIGCGHYQLQDDEALLINLDSRKAASLGFQLADVWGQAAPYVDKTGSLNQDQAAADADGTYTYVISVRDPGVHNWLNPSGSRSGTFCTRWQNLPPGTSAANAVRQIKVVKLADLKTILPAGTESVTPKQRQVQIKERAASYNRRILQ